MSYFFVLGIEIEKCLENSVMIVKLTPGVSAVWVLHIIIPSFRFINLTLSGLK